MDRRYASIVLLLHPNSGRPRTFYVQRKTIYLTLLALVAGVPVGVWGAYEVGRLRGEAGAERLGDQARELKKEKSELEGQVADLREKVGELRSKRSMRSGEVRKLREMTDKLQARIHELQDQVGFYRNILDPQKADRDASMKELRIRRLEGQERSFHFTFKLVQGIAKQEPVTGYARVAVAYRNADGEEKVRFFPEGSRYRRKGMDTDFRYFQQFDGRIELPPKADPLRVTVQLYNRKGLGELLSQTRSWDNLVQARKDEGDAQEEG